MIQIYNDDYINIIPNLIYDDQFIKFDTLILDLNNLGPLTIDNYDEFRQNFISLMSYCSHTIRHGANIILVCNNLYDNLDIDLIMRNILFWNRQQTLIYKSNILENSPLLSEYVTIYWYSDNFRPDDPKPICNNFINNQQLSNFIDNKSQVNVLSKVYKPNFDLYEFLIKMFSNENDLVFDPCMGVGLIGMACKNLNRNYIGIERDNKKFKTCEIALNL